METACSGVILTYFCTHARTSACFFCEMTCECSYNHPATPYDDNVDAAACTYLKLLNIYVCQTLMGKNDRQALLGHVAVWLSGFRGCICEDAMLGLAWPPHFSFPLLLSSLFSCFFHLPRRGHASGQAKALEGPGKPQGQVSHGE